ncbi:MAG: GNAT family N-acetyltransferase [Planctomycetaceae bacterium]|nr:GNAT family N-acetyltransferase [Planctomycetaceae bacterium]
MLLREATAADAHAIATIHVQSWQAAYQGIIPADYLQSLSVERREAVWRELLDKKDSQTFVAEEQGAVQGWINIGPSRDVDAPRQTAEVWALYVDPLFWGRGFGAALWAEALKRCTQMGFTEVTLWVLRDNHRAIRFYRAAGFQIEAEKEQTLNCGGVQLVELRMRRQLGS